MAAYVATKAGAAGSEAEASSDPVAALHDGWRQHVEFGLTHPTLFVVLADPLRPSAAAADGDDILRARIRRVAAAGLLRVSEDRAVALVHAAGTGVILTLLSQPPERRAAEDLADTAWDAVAGSILAARPAPRPDDAVSVTVAFRTIAPTLPGLSVAERGVLCEWLDRAIEQGTFPRG